MRFTIAAIALSIATAASQATVVVFSEQNCTGHSQALTIPSGCHEDGILDGIDVESLSMSTDPANNPWSGTVSVSCDDNGCEELGPFSYLTNTETTCLASFECAFGTGAAGVVAYKA